MRRRRLLDRRSGGGVVTTPLIDGAVWQLDLGMVNAFLVDDGEVTLVDAGTPRSPDDIRSSMAEIGYEPSDVDRVLITHYDLDHVGGITGLDLDAPIYVREPDASYVEGSASPSLTNRKGLFQRVVGVWLTPPDEPSHRIEDGDSIGGFDAHATPGHTAGHTAFVHEGLGIALVGDLVRGDDGVLSPSPSPMTRSTARNARSIRELAGRELDIDIVAMGHGDPVVEGGAAALADLARRLE
ncbi:Glyoxylase, beta-lactamase superfamily II [Natronoarchaeum philippinense]|uniref:Glyoxylase, beta-lactamase superfamily II n=1 Tax=Natronoarchaeum philippinense TaxID=558529 RepID=A0A285NDH4_NATPI|nr:MBL fold metallo-hydrolase [Natronoarchaeum philippinense]SNZ05691.1 Glyoxylase, beta-lactamase superfamily II [Natronoarchaeum philippinense]